MSKIPKINKCRKDFICEVIILFLSIKGRINFLQCGRYGLFREQRLALMSSFLTRATSINQAKKQQTWAGYWSGCAGKAKWGFEIGNIDKDYFTLVEQAVYSAIVYSKSLKRNIWLAYVLYNMGNGKQTNQRIKNTSKN